MSHLSSTRRPIIGLTTYAEQARFGTQDTLSAALPMAYVRAVHASGGRAVLITPDDPDADVLDHLDGIVLTGGADVDPAQYGEAAHPATYLKPYRDTAELLLLRAALAADLPLLGICRGMQLMAVDAGGRLHQHLPDLLGHQNHRPAPGKAGEHRVDIAAGSLAQKILGDELTVNSLHHQGVADPGRLTATGWCPADELIEVVEDAAREFALGVQWHPEDTTDFRLFAALVEAAREGRSRRSGST
jgi:putative glutamine amidotransferase